MLLTQQGTRHLTRILLVSALREPVLVTMTIMSSGKSSLPTSRDRRLTTNRTRSNFPDHNRTRIFIRLLITRPHRQQLSSPIHQLRTPELTPPTILITRNRLKLNAKGKRLSTLVLQYPNDQVQLRFNSPPFSLLLQWPIRPTIARLSRLHIRGGLDDTYGVAPGVFRRNG